MLRTLVLALALAAPGIALAEEFPESAVGIEVVSDDGTVVGRVEAVQRDSDGRVQAVEISNAEPASAPYASEDLVAQDSQRLMQIVSDRQTRQQRAIAGEATRIR